MNTPKELRKKYLSLLKRNDLTEAEVRECTNFLTTYGNLNAGVWENTLIIK